MIFHIFQFNKKVGSYQKKEVEKEVILNCEKSFDILWSNSFIKHEASKIFLKQMVFFYQSLPGKILFLKNNVIFDQSQNVIQSDVLMFNK